MIDISLTQCAPDKPKFALELILMTTDIYIRRYLHFVIFGFLKKKIECFLTFEIKTSTNMMSSAAGGDRNNFISNEED